MVSIFIKLIGQYRIYLMVAAFLSAIGGTGYLVHQYHKGQEAIREEAKTAEFIAEIEKRQREYNAEVERLTKEALDRQNELSRLNTELEKKYHAANRTANLAYDNYRKLLNDGWRLRDKGSAKDPGVQLSETSKGGAACTPDGGNGTPGSRPLSRETSELLIRMMTEADQVVAQLLTAQEYAKQLRAICTKE